MNKAASNQALNIPDDALFEAIILVTRGDELPKKNYERKKHPTYETSIRIKSTAGSTRIAVKPHTVVKFFDQYRSLQEQLMNLGIGENKAIHIEAQFPPTHKTSMFGVGLGEEMLQQRCYLLNKWMQNVFAQFHHFPNEAVKIISQFLSLCDDDEENETNKELILSLIRRKAETDSLNHVPLPPSGNSSNNLPALNTGVSHSTHSTHAHPPQPGSSRASVAASSRRFSTYASDKVSHQLANDVILKYAEESFINHFLAVHVIRSDLIPKSVDNPTKLHQSYEACIRLLPYSELSASYPQYADLDEAVYNSILAQVSGSISGCDVCGYVSIKRVFDNYRTLKLQLEECGVFVKENEAGIKQYNENVLKVAKTEDTNEGGLVTSETSGKEKSGALAKVIDSPFPRTLAKSSMGMSLSDEQILERTALLNKWIGELCRQYASLPPRAQELIIQLFDLPFYPTVLTENKLGAKHHIHHAEDSESSSSSDSDDSDKNNGEGPMKTPSKYASIDMSMLILAILRKQFVPPLKKKKSDSDNEDDKKKASKKSKKKKDKKHKKHKDSKAKDSKKESVGVTKADMRPPREGVVSSSEGEGGDDDQLGNLPANSNLAHVNSSHHAHINSAMSELTTSTAMPGSSANAYLSPELIMEYSKPTTIHHFLTVHTVLGEKVSKNFSTTGKLHQGYKTTLQILPFDEVSYSLKHEMDVEDYVATFANQSELYTVHVNKVFDAYRNLKETLESRYDVHCHNELPPGYNFSGVLNDEFASGGKKNSIVVLEATFPKTYRRSSYGVPLTEKQIQDRGAKLNRWMGVLMSKFHLLPLDCQEYILCNFFNSDPLDPAEPQNKVIYQILTRKFEPRLKPRPPPSSSKDKHNKQDTNNKKKNKRKGHDDEDEGGNAVGSYSYGNKNHDSDDEDGDHVGKGGGVAMNACCTIM